MLSLCRFAGALGVQDGGQGQPLASGPGPLPLPEHSHGVSRQFTYNSFVYPSIGNVPGQKVLRLFILSCVWFCVIELIARSRF